MTGARDPRELRILADILALVLAQESGEALAALAAVRRRAARDGVTGGALKALFQQLHPSASMPGACMPAHPAVSMPVTPREGVRRTEELRAAVTELQRRLAEARLLLERERRDSEALRRRVEAALPPRAETHAAETHAAEAARLRIRVHELERWLTRDKMSQPAPARPPLPAPGWRRDGRSGWMARIAALLLAAGLAADHPPRAVHPAQAPQAGDIPARPILVSL